MGVVNQEFKYMFPYTDSLVENIFTKMKFGNAVLNAFQWNLRNRIFGRMFQQQIPDLELNHYADCLITGQPSVQPTNWLTYGLFWLTGADILLEK